eukprot:9489615-Pyramimonas_sp.AAC.1
MSDWSSESLASWSASSASPQNPARLSFLSRAPSSSFSASGGAACRVPCTFCRNRSRSPLSQ